MSWAQAVAYFLKEAIVGLRRGWRTSLLAISTIAVSLFLTGVFLLLSTNLEAIVDRWRDESRVMVYLADDADEADLSRVMALVGDRAWVVEARTISAEAARDRFVSAYPSMSDLLDGFEGSPLPPAVEVEVDWTAMEPDGSGRQTFLATLDAWRSDPAVTTVDDDRDWLDQLETVTVIVQGLAAVVAGVLVTTAIFTIASVIRLAAHQHRDEIAVLRMVGATEFFIRGPFYAEGLIQGALGGGVAVATLGAGFLALRARIGDGVLGSMATSRFLPPLWLGILIGVGALAGLIGAVVSLGRERTDRGQQSVRWNPENDAS